MRASEYRRQSWYFLRSDLDDPRLREGYARHVAAFAAATALMDHPAERVRIPYEGTTPAGYLYAPDDSGTSQTISSIGSWICPSTSWVMGSGLLAVSS